MKLEPLNNIDPKQWLKQIGSACVRVFGKQLKKKLRKGQQKQTLNPQ